MWGQEEAREMLAKLSLTHSCSTLSSGSLPTRNPTRKNTAESSSSQSSLPSGVAAQGITYPFGEGEAMRLGEEILYEESFRQSLQMLIMEGLQ
jgi:hypothetical protein